MHILALELLVLENLIDLESKCFSKPVCSLVESEAGWITIFLKLLAVSATLCTNDVCSIITPGIFAKQIHWSCLSRFYIFAPYILLGIEKDSVTMLSQVEMTHFSIGLNMPSPWSNSNFAQILGQRLITWGYV